MIGNISKLLGDDAGYFDLLDNGKLQCKLNGHTMPNKPEVVTSFLRCVIPSRLAMVESFVVRRLHVTHLPPTGTVAGVRSMQG